MSHFIYALVNNCNNKVYIGQTVDPQNRFTSHLYVAEKKDTALCRALRLHGKENFQMITVETCTPENADEREMYWIKRMNCLVPLGYNISEGGGRVNFTSEMREAVSKRRLGAVASEETKLKQRLAQLGEKNWNWGNIMRNAHKVLQYDLTGTLVKTHDNINEAVTAVTGMIYSGQELKNKRRSIQGCINGKNGQKTAFKMMWRYLKNGEEIHDTIKVPKYKVLPEHMRLSSLPRTPLDELIVKATTLFLTASDYPHCGIHNSNIPLSDSLQQLAMVRWCEDINHYKDRRDETFLVSKREIFKRLKGMTSWSGFCKIKNGSENQRSAIGIKTDDCC